MGPHFFKCGKNPTHPIIAPQPLIFNGAALFQVRKAAAREVMMWGESYLQWGRTFSSAESAFSSSKSMDSTSFFNGAALFQVRKAGRAPNDRGFGFSLQWGRTFSSAESALGFVFFQRRRMSSMGPHFFKCGKQPIQVRLQIICVLSSMGPHFFKCGKKRRLGNLPAAYKSSMGPHFFKCGKKGDRPRYDFAISVFNGAALFQVRKEHAWMPLHVGSLFSSMGPHFFKCGKNSSSSSFSAGECSSMGPHFFKCGKRGREVVARAFFPLFNGAALFQVRKVEIQTAPSIACDFSSMGPHFFKCGKQP